LSGENNVKELALEESMHSILSARLNAGTVHLGIAPKFEPSRMIRMKTGTKIKARELPEVEF
jgi:hypothetical protein